MCARLLTDPKRSARPWVPRGGCAAHAGAQVAAVSACAGLTAFSTIRKATLSGDAKQTVLFVGAGGVGMMGLHLFKCGRGTRLVV